MTLGLMSCSVFVVHLWDGHIESHFHFFVMMGMVALYQEWVPFLTAAGYVSLHHGFDLPSAHPNPLLWAKYHGAFVLVASIAHLFSWRLSEEQRLKDRLTRLDKRRAFEDRLAMEFADTKRARPPPISVLYIDVDDFKLVNNTYGSSVGDALLLALATRLKEGLRTQDSAARMAGDEFAVLLCDTDFITAEAVAQRMKVAIASPYSVAGNEIAITCSIGIASHIGGEGSVQDILRDAEVAVHAAKIGGGARIERFASSMSEELSYRLEMRSGLLKALVEDEFRLFYQPVVQLPSGDLRGAEALIRWQRPNVGLVPPLRFIPLAEQSGLILPIGEWVLREACRQMAEWTRSGLVEPGFQMGVNVSVRQLVDESFVNVVASAIEESGIDPLSLVLEITESAAMTDPIATLPRLDALKKLGVRLALDDFGTGYSSLASLRSYPVEFLKIDRSFVTGVALGPEDAALARAVLRIAESMDLDTISEGVETLAQAEALLTLGAELAQGFLYSPPVDAATFESVWLKEREGVA